ncbi:hypothetical protein TrCOL_g12223 [Triparma columacea]|uniref:C2 domain-containing protein n=1 Tax=Triparma columacea TaxID=722753 RepID=A0A9W7GGT9_9STRA|nr:hypothetical protein TrCOL_g12223 [Triparma columacea]
MASLVSGASPVVVCISLLRCTDLPISDYGVGHLLPEFSVFGAVKDAAANLPGMGEPSSDPYCVFKLLNRDTSEQTPPQKSVVIYENLNPTWVPPQKFHFQCPSFSTLGRQRLFIDVMDYDYMDRDDYLGSVVYNLSKLTAKAADTKVKEKITLNLVDVKTGEPVNSTVSIEVEIVSLEAFNCIRTDVVFEYERWTPTARWGSSYPGHLLPTDPGSWSDSTCSNFGMDMTSIAPPLPEGWKSPDGWVMVCGGVSTRPDGWQFGNSFKGGWSKNASNLNFCRRRRWERQSFKSVD